MPPVHAIEVAVLAAALLVFSFIPAILNFATSMRRRAPQPSPAAPSVVANPPPAPSADAEAPVTEGAPLETALEPETEPATPESGAADTAPEEPPIPVEELDEGDHSFCLDDLRHARAMETPDREALRDPEHQQAWEEGIRLAEAHAAKIGRMPLSASFEPQARAFHEMRQVGEIRELRFLLFSTLWPSGAEQAAAEAVFEIGPDGVGAARVVRRSFRPGSPGI